MSASKETQSGSEEANGAMRRDASIPLSRNTATSSSGWRRWLASPSPPTSTGWSGSKEEYDAICARMVEEGRFIKLNEDRWPGCFYARSDANDVARVEDRTFVCSLSKDSAGPTNNWVEPVQDAAQAEGAVPGLDGRPDDVRLAVQHGPDRLADVTDRRAAHRLCVRRREHADHGPHRTGRFRSRSTRTRSASCRACTPWAPRSSRAQQDVPWPCNQEKYIVHFPETREIWSYGSGYGGNALLGKKCFALRIASNIARDEGWMAEHMLILGVEDPRGEKTYVTAAFPSACGKTNFAMMIPPAGFRGVEGLDRGRRHRLAQARRPGPAAGH